MDVGLSRRAALVVATRAYAELSVDECVAFANAVDDATGFDTLPKRWRDLITLGESQWAKMQAGGAW
jgi:hypothetical protein